MPLLRVKLVLTTTLLFAGAANAQPSWHWEDRFTDDEKAQLIPWISHADAGLEKLFGPLPYDYRAYFYRHEGNEPVP